MSFAEAISARVPRARFGGPDTGAASDWVTRFGEWVAPRLGSRLIALTGHYDGEGPPDDPRVTTARLLAGDPRVTETTAAVVRVADAHHLTYHMTEGNSCYRGGKPGMSDAFASALWAGEPALDATSGVTLGGAAVRQDGAWTPTGEPLALKDDFIRLDLAPATAALVFA